ncbi:MAG: DUF1704 domain-containing protein [Pseudobdellovibrionaceae bacterium]|nr:DUF1704 domain-containing protein [Bdellovibrionales bacterium]USN47876.1 MAG: DUF1704 domain-containing protein [Pseudobdellovibrionaceae bacterium]
MDSTAAITKINDDAYSIGKNLRLLGNLAWPVQLEQEFLKALVNDKAHLPEVVYEKVDYSSERTALSNLLNSFTPSDPLEKYTYKTIQSYMDMIDLNHAIGTDSFTELSKRIFGTPGDALPASTVSNIDAARQVVDMAHAFEFPYLKEPEVCIMADSIKAYLDRRISGVFHGQGPEVEIVTGLAAKATATGQKVRIRAGTHFTEYDFKQLFYHEVMIHSLTAINGSKQNVLKCMGSGSLRTLKAQEGLATFSEAITGSLDINRMKRISLRILAIDLALKGASFRDVYQFFKDNGQSVLESYTSTQRIFRGGYPDKNIIFTKDCIYLDGLMNVHTLFRWAMKHNRMELAHLLFCGRVSLEDVFELEEPYRQGIIVHPEFLPGWFKKIEGLAGSLIFSLLANVVRINIDGIEHGDRKDKVPG